MVIGCGLLLQGVCRCLSLGSTLLLSSSSPQAATAVTQRSPSFRIPALLRAAAKIMTDRSPVLRSAIATTWNGKEVPPEQHVHVELIPPLASDASHFKVTVDAPFYDDPAPEANAGSTMHLWDYEVAELFLLGDDQRYLELEFGPHGHYLALKLHGPRNLIEQELPLEYTANITRTEDGKARWHGTAIIPASYLPPNPSQFNAYAIHGVDQARSYMALFPSTGSEAEPDFHRLQYFQPLPPDLFPSPSQSTATQ
ncbi:hypothetical protein PTSG_05558 [Salpingoeca rosetta]|uniref:Carbohydrate-binding domain-containing protein n=1 Tax=Salpingoeca rosetta (strain ATCC 50818 / BSB-021) TaxID=946362 RepID=F2UBJ7_SALR5|nr:uncharacterized protein PTSG_05558 [Salpingoeca rosetta]EGD73863.1 hypothetical protein PTSG_05558 [Salpingoeca rosetta]|eukprot:XP_004993426.1 hypothetical protein PTSG_05558 [Salpingoeca rosetta]